MMAEHEGILVVEWIPGTSWMFGYEIRVGWPPLNEWETHRLNSKHWR